MTVKELKEKLNEMPDNALVIVVNEVLTGNQITAIKHRESTSYKDGIVQIRYKFAHIHNYNIKCP